MRAGARGATGRTSCCTGLRAQPATAVAQTRPHTASSQRANDAGLFDFGNAIADWQRRAIATRMIPDPRLPIATLAPASVAASGSWIETLKRSLTTRMNQT